MRMAAANASYVMEAVCCIRRLSDHTARMIRFGLQASKALVPVMLAMMFQVSHPCLYLLASLKDGTACCSWGRQANLQDSGGIRHGLEL